MSAAVVRFKIAPLFMIILNGIHSNEQPIGMTWRQQNDSHPDRLTGAGLRREMQCI
jgi:hypothetical protein